MPRKILEQLQSLYISEKAVTDWKYKRRNMELYDFQSRREVRQASQTMKWCNLRDFALLLDVACGTGDPARGIAGKHPNVEVIGIDVAETRVKQGKKWASEDGLTNIHFVVGDFDFLPFKEGLFDTATCVGAFQHFTNPVNTLCEVSKVLKLNGRFVLSTILVPEDREGYDFVNKLSRLGVFPGGCLGYPSKSELEMMFEACGFKTRLVMKDADKWREPSREPALAGKEVADAARKAPRHLRQRFKLRVEGEKVFFDYPKPLVTAVAKKIKAVSRPKPVPKPRYLTPEAMDPDLHELPVQVMVLLEKYHKKLVKTVHDVSEEELQKRKSWTLEHPEKITGGVGVVAKKDEKFVLVRHTPESWGASHRYWAFPGGGVKPGEDFEEAATREFKEETGLDVEISKLISVQAHVNRSPRGKQSLFYVATFGGEVVGGEIKPRRPDEIAEVKLFEEVPTKELVPWLKDQRYIEELRGRQDVSPDNTPKTVVLVLRQDDKILFSRRSRAEPHLRGWIPLSAGGHIENGETPEEAITREAKEELGIHVKITRFLGQIEHIENLLVFEGKPLSQDLMPDPREIQEIKWVTIKQAEELSGNTLARKILAFFK